MIMIFRNKNDFFFYCSNKGLAVGLLPEPTVPTIPSALPSSAVVHIIADRHHRLTSIYP